MFDKDITIINKFFDKSIKKNVYKLHGVKGFWSSNNGITISDTQLLKSNGLIVRILMSEDGYVSPNDYEGDENTWTLKNDDYLVKGIVEKIDSINDIVNSFECMKISNISIKDYGSSDMQHFAISGE
mgnify:FL=1